ncbi:hypothetical protein FT663_03832 [Candidozyma haemuli var. vulneris]|nr:hypothetical protein FT662_04145 [[Candida] haemuloni var. vulneris]KAF3988935.1 hypothetical protein FT663_03832 [[Candida] haemuloni var. vulneris]
MDELKRYLVELSNYFCFKDLRAIKVNIYRALYWAVTNNGEFIKEIFPAITEDQKADLKDFKWDPNSAHDRKERQFYTNFDVGEYSHPRDQICGYSFKEGDTIYRCEECAYDETCVLCAHCFNKDDHFDHNVSFTYASSGNEGMCDCGDDSAFVRQLNCGCQETLSLNPGFQKVIHELLRTVFSYSLDVTNFSITPLRFIQQNLGDPASCAFDTKKLSDYGSLSVEEYGAIDLNSDESWYLVLWNDENHNFEEAQTAIRAATGVSNTVAERMARLINSSGRAVLREASHPSELKNSQRSAGADGLVSTILSRRDYVREMIVDTIFNWVSEIISFPGNSAFREECKRQLSAVLLEPGFQFTKSLSSVQFHGNELHLREECSRSGIIMDGTLEDLSPVVLEQDNFSLDSRLDDLLKPDLSKRRSNSRLQFLLFFDIRFPLRTRKRMRKIILSLIGGDRDSKAMFAKQYIECYPQLLLISALSDREETLSCMDHIRVQLFTCPKTNQMITESNSLPLIVSPLCWLIENFATTTTSPSGFPNIKEIIYDLRSKREKSAIERAITSGINDLTHVLGKNMSPNIASHVMEHGNYYHLLLLMKYFQGSSSITRKLGDHVGQELLKDVLVFLQRAVPIYYISKSAMQVSNESQKGIAAALSETLRLCAMHQERHEPTDAFSGGFKVSTHQVSLINPINAFLSHLIQFCPHPQLNGNLRSSASTLLYMVDFSLRSIVLVSQVKVGLWIRNGAAVSRQASYYSESTMREMAYIRQMHYIQSAGIYPLGEIAYARDLHLLQTGLIFGDSVKIFDLLIDRWEIKDWYHGKIDTASCVYEERFAYICEQIIRILYQMFTDRTLFHSSSKEEQSQKLIMKISYCLCDEPKSFSDLISDFDEESFDLIDFESNVSKCASLQSPSGLTDSGVYRLKPIFYESLDPLSSYVESSRYDSVAESLVKNLAKSRKVKEDEVVLRPQILQAQSSTIDENLINFFTTKQFAKLVYKLMQESINSTEEIYISQLLHLLHAILLEIEASDQRAVHLEKYIDIPVCDLLLTIAESSMSNSVTVKADFLLTKFIEMDARVTRSLLDCFGENHIQLYKKRKLESASLQSTRRKDSAEKRKSKALRKLAKQQRSFEAQNDIKELSSQPKGSNIRHCVVCGEPESPSELFGILLCCTKNSTFWKVPAFDDDFSHLAFSRYDAQLPQGEGQIYSRGYPYKRMREKGLDSKISATVASSCGHGIHFNCFSNQEGRMKFFPCSLCHNIHHSFLPSFMASSNPDYKLLLTQNPEVQTDGESESNSAKITKQLLNEAYWSDNGRLLRRFVKPVLRSLDKVCADNDSLNRPTDKLPFLSRLIANTVRANEIATRIDGNDGYYNFLDQTSAQLRVTIVSLIQVHSFLSTFIDNGPEPHVQGQSCPEESVFTGMIMNYLKGRGPALHFIQRGFSRLVIFSIFELVNDVRNKHYSTLINQTYQSCFDCNSIESPIKFLRKFLRDMWIEVEKDADDIIKVVSFLIESLETVVLTYLRQCAIFWDLVTGVPSENGYVMSDSIKDLTSVLRSQKQSPTEALSSFFELPSVMSFLEDMASTNPTWTEAAAFFYSYSPYNYYEDKERNRTLLEFPGRVSLIDIPDDYNSCVVDPVYKTKDARYDSICLSCGAYLNSRKALTHHRDCCWMPLYFSPNGNILKMIIQADSTHLNAGIPAPYLTVHGEVKRRGVLGKAYLSHFRYSHINKLWLNSGIHSFIARLFFDGSLPQVFRTDVPILDDGLFEVDEDDLMDGLTFPGE